MNFFECCHHCVSPKRYPGCSGKCPEYAESRAQFEEHKAKKNAKDSIDIYNRCRLRKFRNMKAIRDKKFGGYSKF